MNGELLKTRRLIIRRFREEDLNDLYPLLSDPVIMKYLEPAYSPEKTEQFLLRHGLCAKPDIFAAEYGNRMIGYVIYHPYDETAYEAGWVIGKGFQGRGFAQEITEALLNDARMKHMDLVIECVPEQSATIHIAEKYDFHCEGESGGCLIFRHTAR